MSISRTGGGYPGDDGFCGVQFTTTTSPITPLITARGKRMRASSSDRLYDELDAKVPGRLLLKFGLHEIWGLNARLNVD
jgi:hypothetical protein